MKIYTSWIHSSTACAACSTASCKSSAFRASYFLFLPATSIVKLTSDHVVLLRKKDTNCLRGRFSIPSLSAIHGTSCVPKKHWVYVEGTS